MNINEEIDRIYKTLSHYSALKINLEPHEKTDFDLYYSKINVNVEPKSLYKLSVKQQIILKVMRHLTDAVNYIHVARSILFKTSLNTEEGNDLILRLVKKIKAELENKTYLYLSSEKSYNSLFLTNILRTVDNLVIQHNTRSLRELYTRWERLQSSKVTFLNSRGTDMKQVNENLVFCNVFLKGNDLEPYSFQLLKNVTRDILFLEAYSELPVTIVIPKSHNNTGSSVDPIQMRDIVKSVFFGRKYRKISLQICLRGTLDYGYGRRNYFYFNGINKTMGELCFPQIIFDENTSLFKYLVPYYLNDLTNFEWKIYLTYHERNRFHQFETSHFHIPSNQYDLTNLKEQFKTEY